MTLKFRICECGVGERGDVLIIVRAGDRHGAPLCNRESAVSNVVSPCAVSSEALKRFFLQRIVEVAVVLVFWCVSMNSGAHRYYQR